MTISHGLPVDDCPPRRFRDTRREAMSFDLHGSLSNTPCPPRTMVGQWPKEAVL